MKTCSHCDTSKIFEDFYIDTSKKDGYSSYCRECCKEKANRRHKESNERRKNDEEYNRIITEQIKQYFEENKERIRERKKQWRLENLERVREKNRKWEKDNRERSKPRRQKWCEENKERMEKVTKIWFEKNREKLKNYQKQYKEDNPQKIINALTKRKIKIELFKEITKQEWLDLMNKYEWKCFYCDKTFTVKTRTLDHIIPLSKGGRHHISNLIPCCRSCNRFKNARIYPIWDGIKKLSEEKQKHLYDRLIKELSDCNINIEVNSLDQLLEALNHTLRS